jgi:hydroxypyruvate isomerase
MIFQLAACAEMLWRDKPMAWRCSRLKERGFGVGLWNWPAHDLVALERTGAAFTIMNGYLQGRLADDAGADMLLASAAETLQVGKRLGVQRLNLHGTGLGDGGIPIWQTQVTTGAMWLKARDTLHRICDLAEREGVVFTLENLNLRDHPGCPFNTTADVLALVSAVNRPELRINLDLYHTQIGEGDLIRWCAACLPWIGEVQVADNPGRLEPGTGEINYRAVAAALKEMGYRGAIGLEGFAEGDPDAALEAFRNAFTV